MAKAKSTMTTTDTALLDAPEAPEAPTTAAADDFAGAEATPTAGTTEAATSAKPARPEKLSGDALMKYAQDTKGKGLSADELAFGAGYVRLSKETGELQASPDAYSRALAIAFGFVPTPERKEPSPRTLSYRVKSNPTTGNVVVTGAYLRELGIDPGAYFAVILDKDTKELVLQECPPPKAGEGSEAA